MLNKINSRAYRRLVKVFRILALTESLVLRLECYRRYKTSFCHKGAINPLIIFSLFEEKVIFCSRDI